MSAGKIKAKGAMLDKYITSTVDLLKIDCEGAEQQVLKSISQNSYKKIKHIALEYHNHLVDDQDKILSRMLVEKGYFVKKQKDPYNKDIGYIFATGTNF